MNEDELKGMYYGTFFPKNCCEFMDLDKRDGSKCFVLKVDLKKAGIITNPDGLNQMGIREYSNKYNLHFFPVERVRFGDDFWKDLWCICWMLGFSEKSIPDEYANFTIPQVYSIKKAFETIGTIDFPKEVLRNLSISTLDTPSRKFYCFLMLIPKTGVLKKQMYDTIELISDFAIYVEHVLVRIGW